MFQLISKLFCGVEVRALFRAHLNSSTSTFNMPLCTSLCALSCWNKLVLDPFVPLKENLDSRANKDYTILCFQL